MNFLLECHGFARFVSDFVDQNSVSGFDVDQT